MDNFELNLINYKLKLMITVLYKPLRAVILYNILIRLVRNKHRNATRKTFLAIY